MRTKQKTKQIKRYSGIFGISLIICFFFLLPFIFNVVGQAIIYAVVGELPRTSLNFQETAQLGLRFVILVTLGLFVLWVFKPEGNEAGWE